MHPLMRKHLFKPMVAGELSLVVPELTIWIHDQEIKAPARLSLASDGDLEFNIHFTEAEPPELLRRGVEGILSEKDQLTLTGQIEGEIAFRCRCFPPTNRTSRSSGTSTVRMDTRRLHLTAEEFDTKSTNEMLALMGRPALPKAETARSFHAHLIFQGPKLRILDSGTKTTRRNDFLGEASQDSFDTHQFSSEAWEAALIEKDDEIHLHIRNRKESTERVDDPSALVDHIAFAVAFTHGFQPWPVYRELFQDHRLLERWFGTHINLSQSDVAPLTERLGATRRHVPTAPIRNIIPAITEGLDTLADEKRERLTTLHWNVQGTAVGDLPPSTNLLILCSALEGFLRLIAGHETNSRIPARQLWKEGIETLGFKWEGYCEEIFQLWRTHRNRLAHGGLWLPDGTPIADYLIDSPRFEGAFTTFVSAFCGHNGPVVTNRFKGEYTKIESLRSVSTIKI